MSDETEPKPSRLDVLRISPAFPIISDPGMPPGEFEIVSGTVRTRFRIGADGNPVKMGAA